MVQHILFKILLAPFSLLYGLGVGLRNQFYRWNLLKGVEFDLPVISVGNLSVGGAGKTPHIEYLVRLLKSYLEVATLSRGYKRKTKGYLVVKPQMNAEQVGDEPLQFKRKYPDIQVAVSESRALGIPMLVSDHPEVQVVLLDDAFQHRAVKPGMNIMLTEFSHPFTKDYLLPSGRLREWRSAYQRADTIIVSKCPPEVTPEQRAEFLRDIQPLPSQKIYFSYYDYAQPYFIFNSQYGVQLSPDLDVLLICAIARTEYLTDYLTSKVNNVSVMEFEDHHFFTKYDVAQLKENFERLESKKKVIITTEKDAMRLELHHPYIRQNQMPIFAIPVQVRFHFDEGPQFEADVKQFLLDFKV
ncbi:MAG: tetraacyldisaccharide 4'-kinase [Saprospiraceae bacterium]